MTRRAWLSAALASTIPTPAAEVMVVDAKDGAIVESNWLQPHAPQPCGSLVKVFTALAYPGPGFPTLDCHGTRSGCWSASGHGRLGIVAAIAHSCNAYFLQLARSVTAERIALVASAFRIEPPREQTPDCWIGLGKGWQITPVHLAAAYIDLARRRRETPIVEGLRECALTGTAKVCGKGVLAKTGTSVCAHNSRQPGDGWAIGLYPDDVPRYAVLVRVDGAPGAKAAERLASRLRGTTTWLGSPRP